MALTGTGWRRPVRPGNWRDQRLDATSPAAVRSLVESERPHAVFYLSYDRAARDLTVDGARTAARAAASVGARFVFTSTDLVFDGRTGSYSEDVPAQPVMPYGQLKLEAEAAVRDAAPDAVTLRPSLMAGESGIVLRPAYECDLLVRGRPVDLFVDEWRSPVHVDDVARAAWDLCALDVAGTYHVGGPERLSRMEFGRALCRMFRFDTSLLREARRPADRPRDTSLDSSRLARLLGWTPRSLSAEAGALEPARA